MSRSYLYTVQTGVGVKSGIVVAEDAAEVRQMVSIEYAGIPVGEVTVKRHRRTKSGEKAYDRIVAANRNERDRFSRSGHMEAMLRARKATP